MATEVTGGIRDLQDLQLVSTSNYQENMSVWSYPLTPHFYIVKLGFYRGIHYFLIFALKHRLWVLIRTCTHNQCFEHK